MGLQKGSRRTKGKEKLKSIKSKKIMGSTRRLSRFGKEQKKGHRGIATHFITRSKAISSLQVSINDFRRLCVLKGIYPRDPPGNSSFKAKGGRQRVYYHVKDVAFLAHEPLLVKFRQMKSFMKRFRKKVGKGDTGTASKMWDEKPVLDLNHLVRERYPQFGDAIRDLDDALCLIYLFAQLPAKRRIKSETTDACQRLVREWETYVTRSGSLTKVFVSIKGTYYSARVHNEDVTWLVPHKFNIHLPREVDFTLMGWFLDFYQVAMKFILFRLYNSIGFRYPPVFDEDLADQGAHLAAITLELSKDAPKARPEQPAENFGNDEASLNEIEHQRKEAAKQAKHSKSKLKSLKKKFKSLPEEDAAGAATASSSSSSSSSFTSSATADLRSADAGKLFSALTFFLSREVPRESLELCVMSMGGRIGWDGVGSPVQEDDPSITHHIVDRSDLRENEGRKETREYVQPQWVYDSINAQLCLPVDRYTMGVSLPPHLSPFVDDRTEGYIPEYREELDKLKTAAETGQNVDGTMSEDEDSDGEDDGESHLMENQYALGLAAEASGTMYSDFAAKGKRAKGANDDDDDDDDDDDVEMENEDAEDEEDEEDQAKRKKNEKKKQRKVKQEEEHLERQLAVMNKKRKRLYNRMQHGLKAKQDVVDTLQAKREKAAAKEKEVEEAPARKKKKSKRK